ncbi:hypothetical protein D5018_02010 [Parashewanella curva]|uniref:Uncharacterized protein n=1 Tax=Parashewanella curva TaxID=2338552 RepID=A0A3L8Q315_9GAMM|nr:hypothetical protein [Parashewanella curva]RLV61488.1 hypothetical protein D5018_02010 [Parashewanella curva]
MASKSPSLLHHGQSLTFTLTANNFHDPSTFTLKLNDVSKQYLITQYSNATTEDITINPEGTLRLLEDEVLRRDATEVSNLKPKFKLSFDGKKYSIKADCSAAGRSGLLEVQVNFIAADLTKQLNQYLTETKSSSNPKKLRELELATLDPDRTELTPASYKLATLRPRLHELSAFKKPKTETERKKQSYRESQAFTQWEGIRESTQDPLQMAITPKIVSEVTQVQGIQISDIVGWISLEEQNEKVMSREDVELRDALKGAIIEYALEGSPQAAHQDSIVFSTEATQDAPSAQKQQASTSVSKHIEEGKVEPVMGAAIRCPEFKENIVHLSELAHMDFGENPVVFFDADEVLVRGDYNELPIPSRPKFTTLMQQGPDVIKSTVEALKAKGADVFVLSASGHDFLPNKLREADIDPEWFNGVYGKQMIDAKGDFVGFNNKGDRAFEIYNEKGLDIHRPIVLIDDGVDNLDVMAEVARRFGCKYTPVHFTRAIELRHLQLAHCSNHHYDTLAAYYSAHPDEKRVAEKAAEKMSGSLEQKQTLNPHTETEV